MGVARIWGKNLSFYESIYLIDLIYLIPTGKESACQAGDTGSIPGSGGSPGEENGNPLRYSCLGNPVGRGALAGYNPWDHRNSQTQLSK